MDNTPEQTEASNEQSGKRWISLLFLLPFILMPIAKCVDEENDVPEVKNPFDPAIGAAVNRELEKLDGQNLSEEEFKAAAERLTIRELNLRKE